MKKLNYFTHLNVKLEKIIPVVYITAVVLFYLGLIRKIEEIFIDVNLGWKAIVLASIVIGAYLYWTWFRPVKGYKAVIKRADNFIRYLNNRPKAIVVLQDFLNKGEMSEAQVIDIRIIIGNLYLQQGDYQEAEKHFNQAFNIPRDYMAQSEVFIKVSQFYYEAGDYFKSSECIDRALEAGAGYLNQIIMSKDNLIHYIRLYLKANRKPRAIEVYNMLIERGIVKPNKKAEKLLHTK